jgi:hypothetical protein
LILHGGQATASESIVTATVRLVHRCHALASLISIVTLPHMPSSTDFPARGKVIRVEDGLVVFAPANTNYQIKLVTAGPYTGPVNTLIEGSVQGTCRKLWTVPSGGNFVTPIFGPTRIVQGRIKFLDQTSMVVQAGFPIILRLPSSDSAYDLNTGALSVGTLVNATIMPGASFLLATPSVAAAAGV